MLIDQELCVTKDIVGHLNDPEFWDVKIVGSDGVIPVNKTILSMRSQYFRSMFSEKNNFVESQAGSVKMHYPKAVLDKVILYLYSAQLDCDEMSLRAMMDLLEIFNLMNLPSEYGKVEAYTLDNIKKGKYPMSDCLKYLEDSSKLGLVVIWEALLSHLGGNFITISEFEEVKSLPEPMILGLLQEKSEERSQTILRFKTFALWLSANSMDDAAKSEVLRLFNFDDFTFKELTSDVQMSGLYPVDKIMARMEKLYEAKNKILTTTAFVRKCDKWFEEHHESGDVVARYEVEFFLTEWFGYDLPVSTLDRILELCDQDDDIDAEIDKYEFTAACHLAFRAVNYGDEIPKQVVISLHDHKYFTLLLQLPPRPAANFHVTPENKRLYDTWFDQLGPEDGLLSEADVRDFYHEKFELPDLNEDKIWDLSDQDQHGFLDRHEFSVFCHLAVRSFYHDDEIPDQVNSYISRLI